MEKCYKIFGRSLKKKYPNLSSDYLHVFKAVKTYP